VVDLAYQIVRVLSGILFVLRSGCAVICWRFL